MKQFAFVVRQQEFYCEITEDLFVLVYGSATGELYNHGYWDQSIPVIDFAKSLLISST